MIRRTDPEYTNPELDVASRQRRMIAQRLHDEAIPTLLTAAQAVRDARTALPDDPRAALEAIERAADLLVVGTSQVRETTIDLRPVAPLGLSLRDGTRLLATQAIERGHFHCGVRVDPEAAVADTPAALAIIRELLANVARHSNAHLAKVVVAPIPGDLVRITVEDDGVGISKARMRRAFAEGHVGLSLVAARVQDLGGRFDVARRKEGGTRATIELPALGGPSPVATA